MPFNVEAIRADFPILQTKMAGKQLVYLDSAATSQKPKVVIEAIRDYYVRYNANIHRGIYELSEKATEAYIQSKEKAARLINADGIENIVYTRNATESLNLVALTYAAQNVRKGDHILITEMEHHSNIVPWQLLANRNNATLDYIKVDVKTGMLDRNSLSECMEKGPVIVSITQASNVLGTINDVKVIAKDAHSHGAAVIVDGAQSIPHMKVDVKDIDCDFLAFSAHKMFGPTGLGVMYAKSDMLDKMEPLFGGGDMIMTVTLKSHTWNGLPWKFEAGTSNIEGGIAFGAAIDYLNGLGLAAIDRHEKSLTEYALKRLGEIEGVSTFGPDLKYVDKRVGLVAFSVGGVHAHDIAQVFNDNGIAIRAGHHCAMPLVREVLKRDSLARMSFYAYNTKEEIDKAVDAIEKVKKVFKVC